MKKILFILITAAAMAGISEAARADRGKLEGVKAEDIYNSKPTACAVTETKAESEAQKGECPKAAAKQCKPVCPATAQCASKESCPKQAECKSECASCPCQCADCVKILPGIMSEKTCAQNYTTQFGKSWVALGGKLGRIGISGANSADIITGGAVLEGSLNVVSCAQDTFGLNVAFPISYTYTSVESKVDDHEVIVPMYLRPYYRIAVSEDLVITPFADCGIGGGYTCFTTLESTKNTFSFLWAVGGGVEISFLKDFSFTPRYQWLNSEDVSNDYLQIVGCEFAWKFASDMTAIVGYDHYFHKSANTDSDIGIVKLRYEF